MSDGSKHVDLAPGGLLILPALPAGSTIRVLTCGRAGTRLAVRSADPSVRLWVGDRQNLAISLEARGLTYAPE